MFPNSLPQVEKHIKNVQTENIKNLCHLFPLVIFKREIVMDVYRTEVTFFIPMGEMDFCLLWFFAVFLVTVRYFGFKTSNK